MYQKYKIIISGLKITTFLFVFCFISITSIYASDFRTVYDVHYYPTLEKESLTTRVSFSIKITNLKPDLYIKTFSLIFPKTFQIGNIKVSDDNGPIKEIISLSDANQSIKMEFSDPLIGLNITNTFYLEFLQSNLFKASGNTWEVIIPTIENRKEGDYKVTVHIPLSQNKKISISKPHPDTISGDQIIWNDPKNKTIYAVFGSYQMYKTILRYHLNNPNYTKVYTDIALPPDTLYQKIYINSIIPKPDKTFLDEDGNYIGRYFLNPKETKDIVFDSLIQVYAQPRENIKTEILKSFLTQKKYLLTQDKNWTISNFSQYKNYNSIASIYSFVVSKLKYNYGRLSSKISRLGASEALKYPDQAVCTEFSDLFISLAKENGFYARELQGYGFTSDIYLRPLSTKSDVLHSWPEYFDEKNQIWVPLDPTWENTSGIDYFSSLDLNHIVFAIHGKKSDYPYPAGSYKLDENSQDIQITPSSELAKENKSVSITQTQQSIPVNSQNVFQIKVSIENTGNTYMWNYPITLSSTGILLKPSSLLVDKLAPNEKKEFTIEYELMDKWKKVNTNLLFYSNSNVISSISIKVVPLQFLLLQNILIVIGVIIIIYVIIKLFSYK